MRFFVSNRPDPSPQPTHTTNPVPASVSTHQDQPLLIECARDLPWSEKGLSGRAALVVSLGRSQWLVLQLLRVNRGTSRLSKLRNRNIFSQVIQ